MSDWRDEPCDQSKLPWCTVAGEAAERVLHCTEFEAWVVERQRRCGHASLAPWCAVCRGSLKVADLFGSGADLVRLFPG